MKKRNRRIPQSRKRQKKTTGHLKFVNVVYIEKEKIDGKDQIFATCTCDTWRSSPEATTITKVGMEAKAHVVASGGKCQLRPHDPEPEDESNKTLEEIITEREVVEEDDAGTS